LMGQDALPRRIWIEENVEFSLEDNYGDEITQLETEEDQHG
jgi:hypothetical protein